MNEKCTYTACFVGYVYIKCAYRPATWRCGGLRNENIQFKTKH